MTNNLPQSVKDFLTDLKVASPKLGTQIEQICSICYSQGEIDGMRSTRERFEKTLYPTVDTCTEYGEVRINNTEPQVEVL